MTRQDPPRYNILVKNRPGDVAKLTRFLLDEGADMSQLRVAAIGDKASVQFCLPAAPPPERRLVPPSRPVSSRAGSRRAAARAR